MALHWFGKKKSAPQPVRPALWTKILEPFAGAWQRNQSETASPSQYPTLYACLDRISSDIGKLPFQVRHKTQGVWVETERSPMLDLLRRPNGYQTEAQFRERWILSKLTHGNAYILDLGDELHVLDATAVTPLVTEAGAVYYRLNYQSDTNLLPADYPAEELMLPASMIIHDRMHCLYHPLIGTPPLLAAELAAGKNMHILHSSSEFFANNLQSAGLLTAPAGMSEDDFKALESYWNDTSKTSQGRIRVIGADMKFTSFAFKAADSQLVEQMRYSDEQICQPFGIPPFKVGIGSIPAGMKVDDLNQLYYADALQKHIEAMETLLSRHRRLHDTEVASLDLEPLFRMDTGKQAEVEAKLVGMIKTPDEARARFNLPPTGGGNTLWGQHQQYPLGQLAERNDLPTDRLEPEPDITQALLAAVRKEFKEVAA